MEITNKQLQHIIKEEIEGLLFEQKNFDGRTGFPLTQNGAEMIQKNPNREIYKKYKKAIDSIADGSVSPDKIERIRQAVRQKEGVKIDSPAAPADEPKKVDVDDDLYRQRDDLRADPEPSPETESVSKKIKSVISTLMSLLPQLSPELEPKVEPNIAKFIEYLTKVAMLADRKK